MSTASTFVENSGKKTVTRALVSATAIGSLFFGWATFVNWGYGMEQALQVGAGQGGVSFVVSISMAFMLEFFFYLPRNKSLRIPFAVAVTMIIVIGLTAVVHVLIGTPEILKTMALPILMGMGYTTLYSFGLTRMGSDAAMGVVSDN